MKSWWYVLDINPTPWAVGPAGAKRSKDGKRMAAFIGRNQELHAYQQAIKEELARQSPVKVEGQIQITMWFWRTLLAKDKEADGTNLYKGTEDALQGILFDNDRANVSGHFYLMAQDALHDGKVIIRVEQVRPTFPDDESMLIPDEVFNRAWPNGQTPLVAATEGASHRVSGDGSEYEQAEQIF